MMNGTGSEILRRKVVSPLGRHLVAGVTVFRLCKTDLPKNVQNVRNIIVCVFCFLFGQLLIQSSDFARPTTQKMKKSMYKM